MHCDLVSFLMHSCVLSNTQDATCLTLQLCMYCMVLTLFVSNFCLHVLIMTENGDVCAAESFKDLKEKENNVC